MVSVTTCLTITSLIVNIVYCVKKLSIRFTFGKFDFKLMKEIWVFTFFIFINQIIDQINWSVDKFLLGRLSGTTAVAVYGVGGQINTLYLQFSTSISNVFVPKVNMIVGLLPCGHHSSCNNFRFIITSSLSASLYPK